MKTEYFASLFMIDFFPIFFFHWELFRILTEFQRLTLNQECSCNTNLIKKVELLKLSLIFENWNS